MQTLIYKKPIFDLFPHLPYPNSFLSPAHKHRNFLRIQPKIRFKTRISCSAAYPHSPSYGGWDDRDSVQSTESNQLHNVLNFLGIGDKKYVFVYLFGFVCALAISRVKISSIIVFPACAVVLAIGFSIGLVKGGHLKELKLNGNKRNPVDETFKKLRDLKDNLVEYKAKVVNLRNDIRRNVECKQVSVSDLEGYLDAIESVYEYFSNAMEVVENVSGGSQDKGGGSNPEPSRRKKKFGMNGLNFSQFRDGLFGEKFDGSELSDAKVSNKRELMNSAKDQKQANILGASAKERTLNSEVDEIIEDENSEFAENLIDGTRMKYKRNSAEKYGTTREVFDQKVYGYQNKTLKSSHDQRVYSNDYHDQTDEMASQESSYDSIDFSVSMKQMRTSSSFGHQQKHETFDRSYSIFAEEDQRETFQKEMFKPRNRPFDNRESANENIFGSSRIGDDLEFDKYLGEANNLLKEAKGFLKKQVDDGCVEKALNKSAVLLSKAIEMRPMSLLAVGQLGNTYLLHGELKLRASRELRSLLSRSDPLSGDDWEKALHRFDDEFSNKGKITSALGDVCEECEDLLIKAGRKYKLALSIDGNDMRALYNWGLALGFRAQLIADIGPSAARDADKVFLAAIDKFDAMLSKSNVYAPDALFRWGAALQQRSRLRPRNSREKVKLLQQARCLYEDALHMDSGNLQLQKALSSCLSELDYWYR
ncbi:hypothetical protein BUALT_Bualt18G0108000 [Buddleja alternifolia]|uniref:Uncharacterized protein n=1 Tax=Buddleja alternifolia TaxID=168488 RepID=A0AAV6W5W4_9LAMI|nr:hypothetical protein BUALT_Bualt18G0108000 [Buddleja alternifolia]